MIACYWWVNVSDIIHQHLRLIKAVVLSCHINLIYVTSSKETAMQWESPTAIDFRFGMEITMYVLRR
jgi:coenzyme PQQ precursor peptide PqqA